MSIEFTRTIPILRIFSSEKAKEFYIGWLGFKIDWEHCEQNTPKYVQVSRGHLVLIPERAPRGVSGEMQGLDEFHREVLGKNYKCDRPGLEHTPWKARCCETIDPFGNRIRFNEHAAK